MDILQQTHPAFQEGVGVKIIRFETPSTVWVRIHQFPEITIQLNYDIVENPSLYIVEPGSLTSGMLVATLITVGTLSLWDRAVLLQKTTTGCYVFLIDWGVKIHQTIDMIRLLPHKFRSEAPWARRIRVLGVRDQPRQTIRHRLAKFILSRKLFGNLFNINPSPGDAMSATLLLNWKYGEPPRDVASYLLLLGVVDPE